MNVSVSYENSRKSVAPSKKRKPKKNVIIFGYFFENFGDDLILSLAVKEFELLGVGVNIYLGGNYQANGYIDQFKKTKIIRHSKFGCRFYGGLGKLFRMPGYFSSLAYPNGTLVNVIGSAFMEQGHCDEKKSVLRYLVKKNKYFLIGANFGPYKTEEYLRFHKRVLSDACGLFFRDRYSVDLFKDCNANCYFGTDVAFLGYSLLTDKSKTKLCKRQKTVIVSPVPFKKAKNADRYLDNLKHVVNRYLNNGFEVTLFSSCNREGDLEVCKKILEDIDHPKIHLFVYETSKFNESLELFKSCTDVVGFRHHSIISGLIFGCNVYPVFYSEKTINCLKDSGFNVSGCPQIDDSFGTKLLAMKSTEEELDKMSKLVGSSFEKLVSML